MLKQHLTSPLKGGYLWWHHYVLTITVCVICLILGATAAVTVNNYLRAGGAKPTRETHVFRASGARLPQHHSLDKYVIRVHDQGLSDSCVGQTMATIAEIEAKEFRGQPLPMASEEIWTQCNNGQQEGITYNCSYDIFTREGQARLSGAYPFDNGSHPWAYPSPSVIRSAYPFRQTSWRFIDPKDSYTIRYEISHGRPVAFMLAVYNNFYNSAGQWLKTDGGTYWFNHSITLVAYNRWGAEILNSWGPRYGHNGRIWATWNYLSRYGLVAVAGNPYEPKQGRINTGPRPTPGHLQTGFVDALLNQPHPPSFRNPGKTYTPPAGSRRIHPGPKKSWYVKGLHLYNNRHKRAISKIINAAGDRWHVAPYFVAAMLETESNLNPYAERWGIYPDWSCGLSQVSIPTAQSYGVWGSARQICNYTEQPLRSVYLGARILADVQRITGYGPPNGYIGYNAGAGYPSWFYQNPTGQAWSNYQNFLGWYNWVLAYHLEK